MVLLPESPTQTSPTYVLTFDSVRGTHDLSFSISQVGSSIEIKLSFLPQDLLNILYGVHDSIPSDIRELESVSPFKQTDSPPQMNASDAEIVHPLEDYNDQH